MENRECPKCGGKMDEGLATAGEAIRYVSNRQTGAVRSPTVVKRASACLSCGSVELYLDPAELDGKLRR